MIHRHLTQPPGTPVAELSMAAIDDRLERGDLADWAPLAAAVLRDPWGETARRILAVGEAHPLYGVSPLWRQLILSRRTGAGSRSGTRAAPVSQLSLAQLRAGAGLSQAAIGRRLGMNQSEVSRLERRQDLRLSSLRAFVVAAGARLQLLAIWPPGTSAPERADEFCCRQDAEVALTPGCPPSRRT